MASKQLETISGAVEQVNSKGTGIRVLGEWLNVSQYHPIATLPTAGQLVEVQIERTDRGPWINSLKIIGDAPAPPSSSSPDRVSVRLSVLRSAATFAGGYAQSREDVKSSDVLKIADVWLRWALEPEGSYAKGGEPTA